MRSQFVALALVAMLCLSSVSAKVKLEQKALYGSKEKAEKCMAKMWEAAAKKLKGPAIPNCLRMAFHDAGTYNKTTDDGGANGSVLRELDALQNGGLDICAAAVTELATEVRAHPGCGLTSMADIIQVAGAVAVYLAGGPACPLLIGRPDRVTGKDNPKYLPSPCQTVKSLIENFKSNGFANPSASLVVLSGAHTIGKARVQGVPPQCSRGTGAMTAEPTKFDNHYYKELIAKQPPHKPKPANGGAGWFKSDSELVVGGDVECATMVYKYARNPALFLGEWCPHYQEMSMLGVKAETDKYGFMLPKDIKKYREDIKY